MGLLQRIAFRLVWGLHNQCNYIIWIYIATNIHTHTHIHISGIFEPIRRIVSINAAKSACVICLHVGSRQQIHMCIQNYRRIIGICCLCFVRYQWIHTERARNQSDCSFYRSTNQFDGIDLDEQKLCVADFFCQLFSQNISCGHFWNHISAFKHIKHSPNVRECGLIEEFLLTTAHFYWYQILYDPVRVFASFRHLMSICYHLAGELAHFRLYWQRARTHTKRNLRLQIDDTHSISLYVLANSSALFPTNSFQMSSSICKLHLSLAAYK